MRKIFSKIAGLMLGLSLAAGVGLAVSTRKTVSVRADSVSFAAADFAGQGTSGSGSTMTLTKSGVTVTISLGYKDSSKTFAQSYAGSTITFSAGSSVASIDGFTVTANGTSYNGSQSSGTMSVNDASGTLTRSTSSVDIVYSGSGVSSVVLSHNKQIRINTISVTYTAGSTPVSNYTITYDANGGTGEMSDTVGENPEIADCDFTAPSGKVFSKWNTENDGSGTDYSIGTKVAKDLDLYAIWVDKPTCVTLDKIGTSAASAYSASVSTVDITDGSDTYTLNYVNAKKQNDAMIMQKSSGAFISNHTAMPGNITSIVLYINSGASGSATYDVAFSSSELTTATSGIGAVNVTGGNNHEYVNSSVDDAKYFCVTLGAAYNGQVLKIVVNYEEEEAPDPTKKDMVIYTSGSPAAGGSFYYSKNAGTHVFSAYENSDLVSDVTWSVSDDTVATINSSTGAVTTLKPGDVTIYAEAEGYNKASAAVHFIKGALEELDITGSMTKTEYLVGEAWDPTGFTVTGTYHSGWEEDVTSKVSWTYNPASPAVSVTSVTATATLDEISDTSSAQTVSVTKTNPLQAIYSMAANASVDVYGVFVGNKDGNNIIIMNGEYGMDVYKYGCGTNSYVEGETILHVVGKVAIFNGLYEISGTPTITEVSSADVETPVTYSSHGSETAEYASRVTTVTGVPSVTKGDLTADPAAADITLSFSVAGTPVQVFYKKATQTRGDMDTIKAAVDGSKEMTVKGFTAWYNGFQVQMTGLVEAVESYTAEDFSQDLLDQTDAVCTGFKDGDNNHDALVLIWNNLASADKYPSLPSAQKTILAEAERNESGTVVEQAMARYDYLTGKYNLNNFINGRTPVVVAGSQLMPTANINNNSSTIVIVVVALTSISSIGVLLVIKRKRSLVK